MGGEQSNETKEREEEKQEVSAGPDGSGPSEGSASEGSASGGSASEDAPGELPQCMMGDRRVDNMCFMISCTNWY